MAGEWRQIALEEVADEITVGHVGPMASEYVESGVPFLRSMNIEPFRVNENDIRYITSEFHARLRKSALRPGDVVIVRTGKPGATAIIPDWLGEANCSDLVIVRPGKELDRRFLVYVMNSVAQHHVASHLVGAVQQHFNVGSARTLMLSLPPVKEQQAIACILGSLDDKIELNRRMNGTLEAMARAIFKSWFVDFDPVRAKAAGQPPPGLKPALANLFPDAFEDSELGEIPKGWKVGAVGEIAEQAIGGQWGNDTASDGLVPAICLRGCDMEDLRAAGNAPDAPTRYIKAKAIGARLPTEADLLVAASGAGPCGRPLWCASELHKLYEHPMVYSNFVKRFTTPSSAHALYLDRLLMCKFEDGSIHDYINGTSVPNLDAIGLLTGCTILIPPAEILEAFKRFCEPIYQRLYLKENLALAALRDALLPKLISGELRVPDAAQILGRCA